MDFHIPAPPDDGVILWADLCRPEFPKPEVVIDNWSLVYHDEDDFLVLPEDKRVARLYGLVMGHPCHADGTNVTTSRILRLKKRWAETRNTIYRLGEPSDLYMRWLRVNYPTVAELGAVQRLVLGEEICANWGNVSLGENPAEQPAEPPPTLENAG